MSKSAAVVLCVLVSSPRLAAAAELLTEEKAKLLSCFRRGQTSALSSITPLMFKSTLASRAKCYETMYCKIERAKVTQYKQVITFAIIFMLKE